jgi:conjugative relaxase-like TrwC/TraI family protein
MLSLVKLAGTDQRYYLEQAQARVDRVGSMASGAEDYFLSGPEAAGEWIGSAAPLLGVSGPVDEETLRAVLTQRDPGSGSVLPGPASRARVPGYDFMFSIPKSASVLFGIGDAATQRAILRSQDRAVAAALAHLERHACHTRLGKGGAEVVAGAGFVGAAFRHRTSRAGDPQVHTHVLIGNATLRPDGQWGTLDGRALFAEARTAGYIHEAVFRYELTRELGVEWAPIRKGIADIQGVPQRVIRSFSRRRAEVQAKIAEWGRDGLVARQTAAQVTRARKDYDVTPDQLAPEWRTRAADLGLTPEAARALTGVATVRELDPDERADIVERLIDPTGLTKQRSTFDRRDLMRAVAEASRAGATLDQLVQLAEDVLSHPEVVALGGSRAELIRRRDGRCVIGTAKSPRYTTAELLETERRLVDGALARRHERSGLAGTDAIARALQARPSMGADQVAMVEQLCLDGAGVAVVVGPPGTGKTFALDAAREAWEVSGFSIQGAAVANRAARALHEGAGIDSTSVTALLKDLRGGRRNGLNDRSVLVIDEAGMLGTRALAELLQHAERARAKVILVGDPHQLPEIEAGGAFAALARSDGAITLEVNRRQERAHERVLLELWRSGSVEEAIDLAVAHGDLVMGANAEATRDQLVAEYCAAIGDGRDAVMIALRRADVRELNARARVRLDSEGRLGEDRLLLGWGEFAVGDRVICKRNDPRLGIANGDRGEVSQIRSVAGEFDIRFDDGRTVPLDRRFIHAGDEPSVVHGYACTAHVLQGATTDRAFVLGSELAYREWGYTAWSRARESTRYFVCEPAAWDDEHHTAAHEPAASVSDVVRTLERSGANELALDAVDPAAVRAAAARHVDAPYVDAAMGDRPPEPRAARRWDRGVLLLERMRSALRIDDPERPLGLKPGAITDLIPWRRNSRELERARRSVARDDHGHEQGLER